MATEAQQRDDGFHKVKRISFLGSKRPIIMQNENGPCPLIGIGARGVFPFLPSPLKGGAPLCQSTQRGWGEGCEVAIFSPRHPPFLFLFGTARDSQAFYNRGNGGALRGAGAALEGVTFYVPFRVLDSSVAPALS